MGYNAQPVGFESVSAVTATPSIDLGTRRVVDGNEYVYVYNAGNSQANPGLGMIMSGNAGGYSLTISSLTGVGGFFGVVKHATITTGAYGWICVRGFVPVRGGGNTAIVAGGTLVPGADGTFSPETGALTAVMQGYVVTATATLGLGSGYFKFFG